MSPLARPGPLDLESGVDPGTLKWDQHGLVVGVVQDVSDGRVLVQRPADEPASCYAFIGGEYEAGDTFETRIRREFEEETTARVSGWRYLFVVENRFTVDGGTFQSLEHYLEVTLDRQNVESREAHLSQHWLPLARLRDYDLRPHVVRDVLAAGNLHNVSHLTVAP